MLAFHFQLVCLRPGLLKPPPYTGCDIQSAEHGRMRQFPRVREGFWSVSNLFRSNRSRRMHDSSQTNSIPFLDGSVRVPAGWDRSQWIRKRDELLKSSSEILKLPVELPEIYERNIEDNLLQLQRLYLERPGYAETSKLMASFADLLAPLLRNPKQEARLQWMGIADKIHDTLHRAVTSGAWIPTSRNAFFSLIRIATDPEMAEYWLDYQWRQCSVLPGRHDYTAIIQTWANSCERKDAVERTEKVFRELQAKYKAFRYDRRWKPTEAAYVSLLTTLTNNGGTVESARRASSILQEAWDNSERDLLWPSSNMYNAVLNAWARAGNPSKAEAILHEMIEKSFHNPLCTPDSSTFSIVINAWSKSDRQDSAVNAENVLMLMEDHAVSRLKFSLRPSANIYSSVLNCWAKSNHPEAPFRAEAILGMMKTKFAGGRLKFRPDEVAYNTCMAAWARSGKASAPEEVERLFAEMIDQNLSPDHITYMARIDVLQQGRRQNYRACANKALALLNEMMETSTSYPLRCHSNRVLVILGLAGDTRNAEIILQRMIADVRERDLPESGPDTASFHHVMAGYAKLHTPAAAARCEKMLDEMQSISQEEDRKWDVKPNTVSYNLALSMWVCSNDSDMLKRVENLLQKMRESQIAIDQCSCVSVLQAISLGAASRDEKHEKALELLLEMRKSRVRIGSQVRQLAGRCLRHDCNLDVVLAEERSSMSSRD